MPKLTVYSTTWCADCRNLKRILSDSGIAYDEVDIDQNEAAARQVIDWSGGRRVIPTLHLQPCDGAVPIISHNPRMPELANLMKVMRQTRTTG